MASPDLLRRLAQALEQLDVPYLVTGAVASIYWGEPRLTRDVDVVVELRAAHLPRLLAAFPAPEFYADDEAAAMAVRRRRLFNIIQPATGLKIDVMVATMDAFDRSRFARRRRVDAGGFGADFSAPDDVIVKKLVYYREGGSEKHLRDVAGVLLINGPQVDNDYVMRWAERFGVADVWHLVLDELAKREPR